MSAIQIVSDGTAEGSKVLLDGTPLRGLTEMKWRFNPEKHFVEAVLTIRNVEVDINQPVEEEVAAAIQALTGHMQ